MLKKIHLIGFVITQFSFLSCFAQDIVKTDSTLVIINPEIEPTLNDEQKHIVSLWNTLLVEYSLDYRPRYWSEGQSLLANFPEYEIGKIYLKHKEWKNIRPVVLSLQKKKSIYILKTAFIEQPNNIIAIYNVVVAKEFGEFKFYSPFWYYQGKYKQTQYKEINYYTSQDYELSLETAEKMHLFNVYLSDFFNTDIIPYNYYIFKNAEQMCREFGYDYNDYMFETFQNAAEADVNFNAKETSVFAGNNSEFFPHEAVHVYLGTLFGETIHRFFDEGTATWLGNALSHDLDYQIKFFQKYIQENDIDFTNFLDKKYYILTDEINAKYSVGGLVCKLVYDKDGMEGLKTLFLAGNKDEDCYRAIEEAFDIKRSEFDSFIKTKIAEYKEQ